jgi:hypothetical protein
MNDMALRTKQALGQDSFGAPEQDLIPLRWSVVIWLVLAAGSWATVFYIGSLFF